MKRISILLLLIPMLLSGYIVEDGEVKGILAALDRDNFSFTIKPILHIKNYTTAKENKNAKAKDFSAVLDPSVTKLKFHNLNTYLTNFTIGSKVSAKYTIDEQGSISVSIFSLLKKYIPDPPKKYNRIQGIITDIDADRRTLTIKKDGANITFNVPDKFLYKSDNIKRKTWKDLMVNDVIGVAVYTEEALKGSTAQTTLSTTNISNSTNSTNLSSEETLETDNPYFISKVKDIYKFTGNAVIAIINLIHAYVEPYIDESKYTIGTVIYRDPISNTLKVKDPSGNEFTVTYNPKKEYVRYGREKYSPEQIEVGDKIYIHYLKKSDGSIEASASSDVTGVQQSISTNSSKASSTSTNSEVPPPPPAPVENPNKDDKVLDIMIYHKQHPEKVKTEMSFFGKISAYSDASNKFNVVNKIGEIKSFSFDEDRTRVLWGGGDYPFEMLKNGDTVGVVYSYNSDDKMNVAMRIDLYSFGKDYSPDINKTVLGQINNINYPDKTITLTAANGEVKQFVWTPRTKVKNEGLKGNVKDLTTYSLVTVNFHIDNNKNLVLDKINQIRRFNPIPNAEKQFFGKVIKIETEPTSLNPYPRITLQNLKNLTIREFNIIKKGKNYTQIRDSEANDPIKLNIDDLIYHLKKAGEFNDPLMAGVVYKTLQNGMKNAVSISIVHKPESQVPPIPVFDIKGTLESANPTNGTFVISVYDKTKNTNKQMNFQFDSDKGAIFVNKGLRRQKFTDIAKLEINSTIAVKYIELDNNNLAREVFLIKPAPKAPPKKPVFAQGKVVVIDDNAKDAQGNPVFKLTIQYPNKDDNTKMEQQEFTFTLKKTKFTYRNLPIAFSEINIRDTIAVQYMPQDDGTMEVQKIILTKPFVEEK